MGSITKLTLKDDIEDGVPKDGDGDDDVTLTDCIVIKAVSNGWCVTTIYEDGEDIIEVFDTDGTDNGNLQTIKCILTSMGLEQEIKVK